MTPSARAGELLAFAEAELAAGRIGGAADAIYGVAEALAESSDQPVLLGRALWLIGVISMLDGDLAAFTEHASAAIESFELADDPGTAETARSTLAEIMHRIASELDVRERGAPGFIEALARSADRLLARARGEIGWASTDRDREQMAALLASSPRPLPLSRLVIALELDTIEATALFVLIPLAAAPSLAAEARRIAGGGPDGVLAEGLAGLIFERPSARDAVVSRLAPGLPLRRYRLVRTTGDGAPHQQQVSLDPDLLWYLRDAPLVEWPWPDGVTVAALPEAEVVQSLVPVRDGVRRLLDEARGGVAVLAGAAGAGKTTLTVAAASLAGRATLVFDADAIPEDAFDDAAAVVIRNAFLVGAAVYLRCERRVPPLGRLLGERALRLVLGTTPSLAPVLLAEVRRVRADVAPFEVPALPLDAQVQEWRRACAELGIESPSPAMLEPICRAELYIGDIVDTTTEACTRATAEGVQVTAALLGRVLDARLEARLGELLPVIASGDEPVMRRLDPAEEDWLKRAAEQLQTPVTDVADWGAVASAPTRRAGVILRLAGGDAARRYELTRLLASRVGAALAILSLDGDVELSPSHRARTVGAVAAAARARAVLLVEATGGFHGAMAELLMHELERTAGAAVVSLDASQPHALERFDLVIAAAPEDR